MYYPIKFWILSCMKRVSVMESRRAATHRFTSWNTQRGMPCKPLGSETMQTGTSAQFVNTNMLGNRHVSVNTEDTPYHFLWNYCQSENMIELHWKSLPWISFIIDFPQIIEDAHLFQSVKTWLSNNWRELFDRLEINQNSSRFLNYRHYMLAFISQSPSLIRYGL